MTNKDLFHGVLLIHKEKSWTSHDVVQKVRNLLNQKSVGHAGTLDPLAEGLLVLLLGSATKLSSYLLNSDKRYRLRFKFGLTTDTYDLEGEIQKQQEVSLKAQDVKALLEKNLGVLPLAVPLFSAVKIKGKKLYDYARAGKKIQNPIKEMKFYDLEIHEITKDEAEVSISCSKGSYIRSWVHQLGEQAQVGACLTSLTRLTSGFLKQENSLKLEELNQKLQKYEPQNNQQLKEALLDTQSFLSPLEATPHFHSIELNKRNSRELMHGRLPLYLIEQSQDKQKEVNKTSKHQILKIIQDDSLIALLELKPFERIKVLNRFSIQKK